MQNRVVRPVRYLDDPPGGGRRDLHTHRSSINLDISSRMHASNMAASPR